MIVTTYCAAAGCDCKLYQRPNALRRLLRLAALVAVMVAVTAAAPAVSDAALSLNCSGALPPGAACHVAGASSTTLSLGAAERVVAGYWNTPETYFTQRCGVAPSGWVGSTGTYRVAGQYVIPHAYVFGARRFIHVWAEGVFGADSTVSWGSVSGFHAGGCVGY